ncbi:MAG TPA: histidinol-phosphate transaminase [Roseiflexaceae bacterium]|nr:histidinol-phosphate transaminase [Roseiflexaceae bacterium]
MSATQPAYLRPDITSLGAYTPIVPIDVLAARLGLPPEQIIKLDANENPYGPSPKALAALRALGEPGGVVSPAAIYPDPEFLELRRALSGYTGQPVERIICGAGSDELIDLLMRLCLLPGDTLLDCPPTFGVYRFDAGLYGARVVDVPRDEQFELDLEAVADAAEQHHAKLLFLPAPNNPTGNPLPRAAVLRLLELPLLLVIDEAYYEFCGETVVDLVADHANLVVLRTFSKWAGLAGLRVGYGILHESLIGHLWKIKQPYNVSVAAQHAAIASLADTHHLATSVAALITERERLQHALAALPGLHPFPSAANFILCRVAPGAAQDARRRAAGIRETLMQRGILIRYFGKPGLDDCIRISIGTPAQNDALLAALAAVVADDDAGKDE